MDIKNTRLRKVAIMNYGIDEEDIMSNLNTVWVQTMDREHLNILAYKTNIMVEDVNEACPLKYIDLDEFFSYEAENGSHWLVSNAIDLHDMDEFFRNYFHLDEEEAA